MPFIVRILTMLVFLGLLFGMGLSGKDAFAGGPPFIGNARTPEGFGVSGATVYFCYSQSSFPQDGCASAETDTTYYTTPGAGNVGGGGSWAYPTVGPQGHYRIWASRDGVTSSALNYRYLGSGEDSRYAGDLIFSSLPASPELAITFIGWNFSAGSSGFAGSQIDLSVTTLNKGNAVAPATSLRFRLDANNDATWDVTFPNSDVPALPVGWGERKTVSNVWTATAGTHRFEVCTDANNTASEFDELNNCQYMRFEIANSADISGIPDGALIRATGDFDVYIVKYVGAKRFKRLIVSPSVFNSYGHLRWEDIREVAPALRDALTTARLVRAVGDPNVWALYPSGDAGTKSRVSSAESFTAHGLDWDSIYEINITDRDSYATGPEYAEG